MKTEEYPDRENVQPLPWRAERGDGYFWRIVDANDFPVVAAVVTEQEAALIVSAVNSYDRLRKIEEVARGYADRMVTSNLCWVCTGPPHSPTCSVGHIRALLTEEAAHEQ